MSLVSEIMIHQQIVGMSNSFFTLEKLKKILIDNHDKTLGSIFWNPQKWKYFLNFPHGTYERVGNITNKYYPPHERLDRVEISLFKKKAFLPYLIWIIELVIC